MSFQIAIEVNDTGQINMKTAGEPDINQVIYVLEQLKLRILDSQSEGYIANNSGEENPQ